MIIIRQKEFARAIPKELVVKELERRGLAGKIHSPLGIGIPKYISRDFKTVKNPSYVKETEAAWQKWQNQGKSWSTGKYKDLGVNQRINLKGTLENTGFDKYTTNLKTGGRIPWKNKKVSARNGVVDHPSKLIDGDSAIKVASGHTWNIRDFHH